MQEEIYIKIYQRKFRFVYSVVVVVVVVFFFYSVVQKFVLREILM